MMTITQLTKRIKELESMEVLKCNDTGKLEGFKEVFNAPSRGDLKKKRFGNFLSLIMDKYHLPLPELRVLAKKSDFDLERILYDEDIMNE